MKNKSIYFLPLIILISCSGEDVGVDEIEVSISTSNETPIYNEIYTISWESNASQCFAQSSTNSWIGEVPTTGSRDFTAKRKGLSNYSIQCRTSINFATASTEVNVSKELEDFFDFNDAVVYELGMLETNLGASFEIKDIITRDFNRDFFPDVLVVAELSEDEINDGLLSTQSKMHYLTFYVGNLEEISEESPVRFEDINSGDCVGDQVIRFDLNLNTEFEYLTFASDASKSLNRRGICILAASDEGLVLNDDEFLINDTSIDLSNIEVSAISFDDANSDGTLDIFLMGTGGSVDLPFYISPSTDGPYIYKDGYFDSLNTYKREFGCNEGLTFICEWIEQNYKFKSAVRIDSDGNQVSDMLFSMLTSSGSSYHLYDTRTEEGFRDWSTVKTDFIESSISSDQSIAKNMRLVDANQDSRNDIFVFEQGINQDIRKLSFYEKIVEEDNEYYSSINNGDLAEQFGSDLKFNRVLTFDTNLSGYQDIFISLDELPFLSSDSPSDKHFIIFEKVYEVDDDANVSQSWNRRDFSHLIGLNPDSLGSILVDIDLDGDLDIISVVPSIDEADSKIMYKFLLYLNNSLF